MGLLGAAARTSGRLGKRIAIRSKWLARRLWLVALAETGYIAWRHWKRLEPGERDRLVAIARKSKGRPSNLTAKERREADELFDKLGHVELAGSVAATWLPFGWVSRLVTRFLGPRVRLGQADQADPRQAKNAKRPAQEPVAGPRA